MKYKWIIFIITICLIIFVVGVSFLFKGDNAKNSSVNQYSKVEDIVFDEDKVNIYFFWGDGCTRCKEQFAFLEKIKDEYSKYFNLYSFEVWYNDDNIEFMEKLADELNVKIQGVPFTIIGEEYFIGYNNSMGEKIKKVIKEQVINDYDVYQKVNIEKEE